MKCCSAAVFLPYRVVLFFLSNAREGIRQVKRREFITLLGGAAAAWPFAATGRQRARVCADLGCSALAAPSPDQLLAALRRGLARIRLRGGPKSSRWRYIPRTQSLTSLQRTRPSLFGYRSNIICAHSSHRPALAAKEETSEIPIVMAAGEVTDSRPGSSQCWPDQAAISSGCAGRDAEMRRKSVELIRGFSIALLGSSDRCHRQRARSLR